MSYAKKERHDDNNTSLRQKERHDVQNKPCSYKIRHDGKEHAITSNGMSWRQKVLKIHYNIQNIMTLEIIEGTS